MQPSPPFTVKICGVTQVADAVAVAQSGADAMGLNFFAKSLRYISAAKAEELLREAALPQSILRVGVFVNESTAEILQIAQRLQLDLVQLHGDETAAEVASVQRAFAKAGQSQARFLRAFRCKDARYEEIHTYLHECEQLGVSFAAILLDAHSPTEYGGTGHVIDWVSLGNEQAKFRIPVILAGGLKPENVAEAIAVAKPMAVDTASGVESSPGVKDGAKIAAFVTAAKSALKKTLPSLRRALPEGG